ncbi:MAG TPA: hypothetical protein VFX97_04910 [Pyrinomonadaceae bacterium]|nr:hypothetical protein [Pyrinomonadaceae bacterium]
MNRKVFLQMMRPIIVSGLLIVVIAGNANAQAEELLSFNYSKVVIQVSIRGIERQQFLADPVSALRSQGIRVPESAEAPWREFTQLLRRLKPDRASAGRSGSVNNETLHFRIELRDNRVIFLGTGEANVANPPANSSGLARKFIEDPVGTLRVHGMNVPSVEESDWRQLAEALKAVQLAHARSRSAVERKGPADSDSPLASTKPPKSAMNGSLADGRYMLTALAAQVQTANDEASRAAEKQRSLVKQPGSLTTREVAREKAVLQQLEANARRAAEVLESVKRLYAEVERKQGRFDGLDYLIHTAQNQAQTASDQALKGAEEQRGRQNKLQELRARAVTDIDKSEGGRLTTGDNKQRPQPSGMTPREVAREKAVLQQLEANARRAAEVLESVKKLAAEVDRQPRR